MFPKDVHTLIPKTCEEDNRHGKRGFADGIKFGILRWGDYLSAPNVITRAIMGRDRGVSQKERHNDGSRGLIDVRPGHRPRSTGSL